MWKPKFESSFILLFLYFQTFFEQRVQNTPRVEHARLVWLIRWGIIIGI